MLYLYIFGTHLRFYIKCARTLCRTVNQMGGNIVVVCWLLNVPATCCVSQGRLSSDKLKCCHIEIEVPDQTFNLTQSQYTDTGPTSPNADPTTDARQSSHWSASF